MYSHTAWTVRDNLERSVANRLIYLLYVLRNLCFEVLLRYSDTTKYFAGPVAVNQHRRP